eukprot:gene10784-11983_t
MSQSIEVIIRSRPLSQGMALEGESRSAEDSEERRVVVEADLRKVTIRRKKNQQRVVFQFHRVFDASSSQEEVYSALDVVRYLVDGVSGCILAYGPTNTGKTYTMYGEDWMKWAKKMQTTTTTTTTPPTPLLPSEEGSDSEDQQQSSAGAADALPSQCGVIPRAVQELYKVLAERMEGQAEEEYSVSMQFVEIYQEKVFDLMLPGGKPLNLREDPQASYRLPSGQLQRAVQVSGLSSYASPSASAALHLLQKAFQRRMARRTQWNDLSSRSHTIVMIHLTVPEEAKAQNGELEEEQEERKARWRLRKSSLYLVDLAGSERWRENLYAPGEAQANKETQEMAFINTSLHNLGHVIACLTQKNNNSAGNGASSASRGSNSEAWETMSNASCGSPGASTPLANPTSTPLSINRQHIPFRASVLTRLLQRVFYEGKTVFIVTIQAEEAKAEEETYRSLMFASQASSVPLRLLPTPLNSNSGGLMKRKSQPTLVASLQEEIAQLKALLASSSSSPSSCLLCSEKDREVKLLREEVASLLAENRLLASRLQSLAKYYDLPPSSAAETLSESETAKGDFDGVAKESERSVESNIVSKSIVGVAAPESSASEQLLDRSMTVLMEQRDINRRVSLTVFPAHSGGVSSGGEMGRQREQAFPLTDTPPHHASSSSSITMGTAEGIAFQPSEPVGADRSTPAASSALPQTLPAFCSADQSNTVVGATGHCKRHGLNDCVLCGLFDPFFGAVSSASQQPVDKVVVESRPTGEEQRKQAQEENMRLSASYGSYMSTNTFSSLATSVGTSTQHFLPRKASMEGQMGNRAAGQSLVSSALQAALPLGPLPAVQQQEEGRCAQHRLQNCLLCAMRSSQGSAVATLAPSSCMDTTLLTRTDVNDYQRRLTDLQLQQRQQQQQQNKPQLLQQRDDVYAGIPYGIPDTSPDLSTHSTRNKPFNRVSDVGIPSMSKQRKAEDNGGGQGLSPLRSLQPMKPTPTDQYISTLDSAAEEELMFAYFSQAKKRSTSSTSFSGGSLGMPKDKNSGTAVMQPALGGGSSPVIGIRRLLRAGHAGGSVGGATMRSSSSPFPLPLPTDTRESQDLDASALVRDDIAVSHRIPPSTILAAARELSHVQEEAQEEEEEEDDGEEVAIIAKGKTKTLNPLVSTYFTHADPMK